MASVLRSFRSHKNGFMILSLSLAAFLHGAPLMQAQAQAGRVGHVTGLTVPRFVSLKANRARLRAGPGVHYPIIWEYLAHDIPLEITAEYGNWRKVRDWTSAEGWMYHTLLSGRRTAIVSPWGKSLIALRSAATNKSDAVANLEPGVFVSVKSCNGNWCNIVIDAPKLGGYVEQVGLWGVYPGEVFR
ncbi:hypothetical protein ASC71_21365 [Rhizobium sp. Root1240]|nr:hypothetical protein ASC71_21365 [Rhizobium sp. Root1240]